MLVEDHLRSPERDHQLLGRESADLLLKSGSTSSAPSVGSSTLSLLGPLVAEEGLAGEEGQDGDGVDHELHQDQVEQLQT